VERHLDEIASLVRLVAPSASTRLLGLYPSTAQAQ
jgi:hypothetical protein